MRDQEGMKKDQEGIKTDEDGHFSGVYRVQFSALDLSILFVEWTVVYLLPYHSDMCVSIHIIVICVLALR